MREWIHKESGQVYILEKIGNMDAVKDRDKWPLYAIYYKKGEPLSTYVRPLSEFEEKFYGQS